MVVKFGDFTLLTDPILGADGFRMGDPNMQDLDTVKLHRRLTPLRALPAEGVDLVLLSHAHEDHFDRQARCGLDHGLPILLPPADVKAVAASGFRDLDGIAWGQTRTFTAGSKRVKITATIARHSRAPAIAKKLGAGNGYWIEFSDGAWKRTLYWTGDSMPTDAVVRAIASLGQPDLLVPNLGGVGKDGPLGQISMDADDLVWLADRIKPARIMPIHHSTFAFYREPISEFVARSAGKPYRLVIAEGMPILLD